MHETHELLQLTLYIGSKVNHTFIAEQQVFNQMPYILSLLKKQISWAAVSRLIKRRQWHPEKMNLLDQLQCKQVHRRYCIAKSTSFCAYYIPRHACIFCATSVDSLVQNDCTELTTRLSIVASRVVMRLFVGIRFIILSRRWCLD